MALSVNTTEFLVYHRKNSSPAWSDLLEVTADSNWKIVNSHQENQNMILINGKDEQDIYYTASQTVDLKLSNHINELEIGFHQFELYVYEMSLAEIITVKVIITESDGIFLHPKRLDFEAIQNVYEAEAQTLFVYGESSVVIDASPAWLNLSWELVNEIPNFIKITTTPEASINYQPGTYNDVISFTIDGSSDYTVPVRYVIRGPWNKNYIRNVHFTKDNEEMEFFQQSVEDTYLKLTAQIKVRDYFGNEKTIAREWQLVYYNKIAKINLGRELDDYLSLLDNIEDLFDFPGEEPPKLRYGYLPLSIRITAREVKFEDETITAFYEIPFQYFLRGKRPNGSWLTRYEDSRIRVTPKSKIQLNVFKPQDFEGEMVITRNGIEDFIIPIANGNNFAQPGFLSATLDFSKFPHLEAGEVIAATYNNKSRRFIVIEDEVYSTTVYWINEHETLDSFEFTGGMSMTIEHEKQLESRLVSWREILRQIDVHKTQKITISTGWVFKENIALIESIKSARKAFIGNLSTKIKNPGQAKYLELIPIGPAKMSASDEKRALYEYELEFEINRENEAIIYM